MDLHHNLFYGYRGPNADSAERDRQLENNLTKALINTLELSGEAVRQHFLAALGFPISSNAKFLLQRRDLPSRGAASKRHRLLLGISQRKSKWKSKSVPGARRNVIYESVPDAWVYGNKFAVLVESKVGDGDFSSGQLGSHRARLCRSGATPPKLILKTWEEIHSLFRRILPGLRDGSSSRLVVSQFIQYLEYSGMTGFTGFRPDHFDYFVLHDDDDARRWVRDQVGAFAAQVLAWLRKISSSYKEFYEDYDVGNLTRDMSYCWVAFGPRDAAYREATHQSVSLQANGLLVFVNTELKPATDRPKRVLRDSPIPFRKALKRQHTREPFELVIQERIQQRPRVMEYFPILRLDSCTLADQATSDVAWRAFVEMIESLPLPYLRIERLIARKDLLDLSERDPSRAVQHVVKCLERNHEIVEMLND